MSLSIALLLMSAPVEQYTYEPRAEYRPKNGYESLEVTRVEAKYSPFHHEEAKPQVCLASRITFTFTIENKGKKAVKLPKFLVYEANNPKPWMRRVQPYDLVNKPEEGVIVGGQIMLRQDQRITLKPGQTTKLVDYTLPPSGPWNPMKLQVRFAEQSVADLEWVGLQRPFSFTLATDAPDYQPYAIISTPRDGKPKEEARVFDSMALYRCTGTDVGGPVQVGFVFKQPGSERTAMMGGATHNQPAKLWGARLPDGALQPDDENREFIAHLSERITATGPIDWERAIANIKVGCPKHGFTSFLIDANPSNDQRVLRASVKSGS